MPKAYFCESTSIKQFPWEDYHWDSGKSDYKIANRVVELQKGLDFSCISKKYLVDWLPKFATRLNTLFIERYSCCLQKRGCLWNKSGHKMAFYKSQILEISLYISRLPITPLKV